METGRARPTRYRLAPLLFWLGLGMTGTEPSQAAGISLNKTRVIFSQGARAQTLTVVNTTSQAWLVQVRITGDQEKTAPAFVVTPPLFRLEANSQNSLRILPTFNRPPFPIDRESAFVVSLRSIPGVAIPDTGTPERQTGQHSQVQVALQMNIRLFYRPQGVSARDNATVAKQVKFSLQGTQLRVENPTPYFLTFSVLKVGAQHADNHTRQTMVPPKGIQTYLFQTHSFTAGTPGLLVWRFPGDSQDRHVPL